MIKLFGKRPNPTESQTSAYEACDCMRPPPHTPKTLKTCKKKHALLD